MPRSIGKTKRKEQKRKERKTAKIFTCSAEWSDFINFHVSIEEFHWDSIISRYFLICFLGQLACLFAEETLLITRVSSNCLAQFRLSYAAPWELGASAAAAAVAQVPHRCQQRPHYVPKRASISAFCHFLLFLSLARTHWFSRHVPPGVYALHITHTQRGLIKVSAKPPWKVARRIIAPAIWQTQRGKSFPFRFSFRSSRFSHLACYLIFLASLFVALFAVCVAEIVFYLRLPAPPERERGRDGGGEMIARQLQSQFHRGFAGDEGCLFQVAPSNVNLQILTSKCCSGRSKLHGGTFLRFSVTYIVPGERWEWQWIKLGKRVAKLQHCSVS